VSETPVLEVKNLHKSFGQTKILQGVSFRVLSGETICVIGPSGAGKSTLLRCVNWLEPPDSGETYLRGIEYGVKRSGDDRRVLMTDRQLAPFRSRIAMVFQHFALWPHLTVLGNVIESPIHVLGQSRDEATENALRLLTKVGLDDKAGTYPSRLSGGQRQRVGIARALAVSPDVVLFDEPTSSLDAELVGEVLSVLRELASDGLTMVVVTHELSFAREVASEMVFLDGGRIIETGPPDQFFAAPKTERVRAFLQRYDQPRLTPGGLRA
jgi:polar amino acid transport system ATP-binding protein